MCYVIEMDISSICAVQHAASADQAASLTLLMAAEMDCPMVIVSMTSFFYGASPSVKENSEQIVLFLNDSIAVEVWL